MWHVALWIDNLLHIFVTFKCSEHQIARVCWTTDVMMLRFEIKLIISKLNVDSDILIFPKPTQTHD